MVTTIAQEASAVSENMRRDWARFEQWDHACGHTKLRSRERAKELIPFFSIDRLLRFAAAPPATNPH